MNKDIIFSTSSDLQLCPPSPDTREIFRPTVHFSDERGGNLRPITATTTNLNPHHHQQQQRNPRKKRSKTTVVGDSSSKTKYGKKPEANNNGSTTTTKIRRPCSECGKSFWSWKALFGHMRCHPERPWRGINPPTNLSYNSNNNTTNEDRYVASCLLMLAKGPTNYECKKKKENEKGCFAKKRKEKWELDLNAPPQDYSNLGLGLDLRLGI